MSTNNTGNPEIPDLIHREHEEVLDLFNWFQGWVSGIEVGG